MYGSYYRKRSYRRFGRRKFGGYRKRFYGARKGLYQTPLQAKFRQWKGGRVFGRKYSGVKRIKANK